MLPVTAAEAPSMKIKRYKRLLLITFLSPLAAAELVLAVRVTLRGARVVRERELGAAPPVLPPQAYPVPHLIRNR